MGGPTSQNIPTRHPASDRARKRRIAVSLAGTLAFLATAWLAMEHVAGSELGRIIDANLTWLADPRAWIE